VFVFSFEWLLMKMKAIRDKLKKHQYLYYVFREIMKKRGERELLWKDAVRRFEEGTAKHGNLKEYKRALYRHRFLYKEYDAYKLWNSDKKRSEEFISEKEIQCIYRKTVQVKVAKCFTDKKEQLELFGKFVYRKWLYPQSVTFEAFKEFVTSNDCIAKPRGGLQGQNIFLVQKGDEQDMKRLFEYCCKNSFLIEEYTRACSEIEAFHPQSLNTIRVFTISKHDKVEILDAEFRMGIHDNVVDNAHCGGVLASINIDTGTLVGNGFDMSGNEYVVHPDSGKTIKGFVIPHWDEIVKVCKEAATIVPETVFAGWDICVRQGGEIELIEVNAVPGVTGLQTSRQKGLKPRLKLVGEDVLGYNPLKLISVWSRSYVKYDVKYGYWI
jgi:hypothetical protein